MKTAKPIESANNKRNPYFDIFVGLMMYPMGDLIGQVITGDISLWRTIAVALIGAFLYRLEIPRWFAYLDHLRWNNRGSSPLTMITRLDQDGTRRLNWLGKTGGAMLYFNPLWIARHVFIITLATTAWAELTLTVALWQALSVGLKSFITNLPFSIAGNFIVQQCLPLRFRFMGSATLTMLFTIKYAVELRFFN